ncbi:MAG TPA: hypothetical protein VIH88_01950 [Candidatus Acidoferrales bacterium]
MKKAQVALAAFVLLVVALIASGSARADTFTYSYTSQEELNLGVGSMCSSCRVTVIFTVANPLAPSTAYVWNANGTDSGPRHQLDPLDISVSPFFGSDNDSLLLYTDRFGNIEDWQLAASTIFMLTSSDTCTGSVNSQGDEQVGTFAQESVSLSNCTDMLADHTDSVSFQLFTELGPSWTETTNVTTTMNASEPSTLLLLGIGVLLACMKIWGRNLGRSKAI